MNSQSSSASSSAASMPPKVIRTKSSELVTINEKVNLTKEQNKVLQMICDSYGIPISAADNITLEFMSFMRYANTRLD